MIHANLMNNVKVKKGELLDALENNLEKHQADVSEALAARRGEMTDYFQKALERLETDGEYQPRELIKFPLPKDNSDDYKRAIRMVRMTVDEVIELTEDQFDKLVMDNWHWKQELLNTTSLYGKLK